MGQDNVATFVPGSICARDGCSTPFRPRHGGKPQRYCSPHCRQLAWDEAHPRVDLNHAPVQRNGQPAEHIPCPADLPRYWRALAKTLRPYADAAATAYERAADALDAALAAEQDDLLTLRGAAHMSGYSADHLGRLLRQGLIPNAGRPHAPRIRRADLPRRAPTLPHDADVGILPTPGNLARAVASERTR